VINEKGCVQAGEEWLEKNLLVVAGVAVGVAFLQVSFFRGVFFLFLVVVLLYAFMQRAGNYTISFLTVAKSLILKSPAYLQSKSRGI
jgi:hypothetical protein